NSTFTFTKVLEEPKLPSYVLIEVMLSGVFELVNHEEHNSQVAPQIDCLFVIVSIVFVVISLLFANPPPL
ncbi:MAG: hypothetical protein Q8830_03485, partial [Candidatus Phytoplasma australasiaticum]|nr:hypothetical protein [Candidatus Phytoplasma australasiaticum]